MTDINRLAKTRRPSAQHDVGVYGMEQQQRSSCVRTNTQTRVQGIMDDVYGLEEPVTRSRRASSTQSKGTRMRQRPDTDEPYQQYRNTTGSNPTHRSAAT